MTRTIPRRKDKIFIAKVALVGFVVVYWFVIFVDFDVLFNNDKVSIWVHGPSVVEEDETFDIIVEAWDKYERLAGAYTGKVSFKIESYNYTTLTEMTASADLPSSGSFDSNFIWRGLIPAYRFEGADNGKKPFEMSISTPGIHYIIVEDEKEEEYRSNPIIVKPKGTEFKRLYWGDIHAHTALSDGAGTSEEAYMFARDVALTDFAALTDHSELMPRLGDIDLFNAFQNYVDTTNRFNDNGEFVTIVAMEYTPMLGTLRNYLSPAHINVYFEGDEMPFFSSFDQVNQDELIDYIKENSNDDFLAWTHHTTRSTQPGDFAYYNEDINTMVEIFSCHGSSETIGDENWYEMMGEVDDPGYSIRDGLKMGRKYGIMASSDTHDGRMGHNILHTNARALNQQPYTLAAYQYGVVYPGGLTGLYASKLERNKIFNALKTRSGYATTWVNRHYVNFSINGLMVGVNDSTLVVPTTTTNRQIEIMICADGISTTPDVTTKIETIEIIKNSEIWKSYKNINKPIYRLSVNDSSEIKGTSYKDCIKKDDGKWYINNDSTKSVDPDKLTTDGIDYYYIRIKDSNNGAAWMGPIWVEVN